MTYVEEFLYRGRDPENEAGMPSTFNVVLCLWAAGPDGQKKPLRLGPMTPPQAKTLGFDLPAIIAEINQAALADRDAAIIGRDKAIQDNEDLSAKKKQVDDLLTKAMDRINELETEKVETIASLNAAVDAKVSEKIASLIPAKA